MVCLFLHVVMFVPFGKLTDRVGNYGRVMLVSAVILAITSVPMFMILNIGGVECDMRHDNTTNSSGTCVIISGNYSHCPASPASEAAQIGATLVSQLFLTVVLALYGSALPVWMVTSFPPEVRYTAVGMGYNLAQALLGGTAPLIATALIETSHWNASPSVYLLITATVSALTLIHLEFSEFFCNKKKEEVAAPYVVAESPGTDANIDGDENDENEATL